MSRTTFRSAPSTPWSRARAGRRARAARRATERLLALFEEAGVRATFFVLGWVGQRQPGAGRRIAGLGHEIASHGFEHRLSTTRPRPSFARMSGGRRACWRRPRRGCARLPAPSFSVVERSLWALEVLVEEGFTYDASIFPVRHDRYGIPGAPRHTHVRTTGAGTIIEVPGSTVRLAGVNIPIAGGGYFRLLPYAITRWGFHRLNNRERRPVVFYIHPWEVDPSQPRIETGALTRLRHYRNLDQTASRLRALMSEFAFSSIADALGIPPATLPAPVAVPVRGGVSADASDGASAGVSTAASAAAGRECR